METIHEIIVAVNMEYNRFVQPNSTPFPDSFLFWYGPSFYRYLKLKSSLESLQQELANTVDTRKRFALFKKWLAKQNTVFFGI